ncbi:MAG: 50S ribosomal protein L4 [bacterium]|nr:50S ribosomal protein L4 [bacterium]
MKVKIYNQEGKESTEGVDLNPKIFGLEKENPELVHFIANILLSNARNTVASTKTRGEVRGGGRKPWKQKGTGRARHGSIRSPLWRGGGITFGPNSERNFIKKINKKTRRLGLFTVLTDRAKNSKIVVLESLDAASGKTKDLTAKLKNLESIQAGRNVLIILPAKQEAILRAGRNLQNVKVSLAKNLNFLELLWADRIIILKDALTVIEKVYLNKE